MTKPLAYVVDDDRLLGEAYVHALQMCGFTAKHIQDSTKALPLITEEQPVVVLLDMQMPMLNGAQVLKALRENESTADIKVIVATANHLMLSEEVRAQANLVLQKPVSMDQIRQFATRMLTLHKASEAD